MNAVVKEKTGGGPLQGIRVFDWTFHGVGPFSAMLLGALGADVIKIEAPEGDPIGERLPTQKGMGTTYILVNLNKRGIVLDLNKGRDREIALRLLASCDVFVNNMRRGVPEKHGLGYEAVKQVNPKIIYLTCTAWGSSGPMANIGGVDTSVQAFSGWSSVNGNEGGLWEQYRHSGHIDFNTSMYLAAAVIHALVARELTQQGQKIDLSMLGAAISLQTTRVAEYLASGIVPRPLGSASGVAAPDQAFLCQDKSYIAVSALTPGQWHALCQAIDRPDLDNNPDFASNELRVKNRRELARELEKVFASKPAYWWAKRLTEHGVPTGRFTGMDSLLSYPQIVENEHIVHLDTDRWGRIHVPGPPWKFSATPVTLRRNPYPGEHTEEVLEELGNYEKR